MASNVTENTVAGDMLLYETLFEKAYPNFKKMTAAGLIKKMIKDGSVQMDAVVEVAIANTGGMARTGGVGKDFSDGSDSKKAVFFVDKGRRCNIGNLANKIGTLRIVAADPIASNVRYYKIPHHAYAGLAYLKLRVPEPGPRGLQESKWDHYEVGSFEEVCSSN